MDKFSKISQVTSNSKRLFLSNVTKIINGEPCPSCGIVIYKDGGCPHMTCQKCQYEFCWVCLGHYPGYSHSDFTGCPLRGFIMYPYAIFISFLLFFKMAYSFALFAIVTKFLCYYFGMLVIGNLFCASILIQMCILDSYYYARQNVYGNPLFQ